MKRIALLAGVCTLFHLVACGESNSESTVISDVSDSEVSSSAPEAKSSSVVKSSSSSVVNEPADKAKQTMIDSRDGQTYWTVKIGTQTWMAQNLNYESANSFCYMDSAEYCEKYGRLYTWAAAMDSAGTWSTNGKGCGNEDNTCSPTYPVRGVCPEGWHLPDSTEWETLFATVGGMSTAGTKLKSTSGWMVNGNGTDDFGFSALHAGSRIHYGSMKLDIWSYHNEGSVAEFWSSTEHKVYYAKYISLNYNSDAAIFSIKPENFGSSVRCLQD